MNLFSNLSDSELDEEIDELIARLSFLEEVIATDIPPPVKHKFRRRLDSAMQLLRLALAEKRRRLGL